MAIAAPMLVQSAVTVSPLRRNFRVVWGALVALPVVVAFLFIVGCGSVAPQTCRLAVVEREPGGIVRPVKSDCEVVPAAALAAALPTDRQTVTAAQRLAFKESVVAASSAYYDDPDSGRKALEENFARARQNPGLLPTNAKVRNQIYQSLAVLLLARYIESQEAGDELASWLANHLPDQVPSAKQLPPKLSVRAAEALRRSHARKGPLSAAAPPDCEEASLLLDGRVLGTLPLRDVPVHLGRHAVWFECGDKSSWVRFLEVSDGASLAAPRIDHEAAFTLSDGQLRLVSGATPELAVDSARRLLSSLDIEAVALLANRGGEEALVVTATGNRALVMSGGPVALTVSRDELWPRSWTSVAKWVVAGVSVAALGGGMTFHALHDREIDKMSFGTVDTRGRAERWQNTAIGGYAVAASAAVGAIVLFIVDRPDKSLIDPLFPPVQSP
jgi:hypothetical protein